MNATMEITSVLAERPGLGLATCVVIATVAAGAAAIAWLLLAMIRRDRRLGGPLLRHLARGTGIGVADRRLLHDVAHRAGLRRAGAMLISEGCFEFAVERARPDGRARRRLGAIRRRVFGTSSAERTA